MNVIFAILVTIIIPLWPVAIIYALFEIMDKMDERNEFERIKFERNKSA